jgi:hypothetical protein
MKLSLSQKWELTEALKKASVSKCWICVKEILGIVTNVLEKKKFWYIDITEVSKIINNIEYTRIFNILLKLYVRHEKRKKNSYNFEEKDILSNIEMFKWFEEFCLFQSSFNKLNIVSDKELFDRARLEALLDDFKTRYSYHVRKSTKYYDEIIKKLNFSKHSKKTRRTMLDFNAAYHLMKLVFSWKQRNNRDEKWNAERCFEHLQRTMEIVMRELPNPNINKIIIALLHDVIEDIPWTTFESIKNMFWEKVACWVRELSKEDWRNFLDNDEEKEKVKNFEFEKTSEELKELVKSNVEYKKLVKKWKEKRNLKYFWNLKELKEDIMYVKFADRIHNLRTLKWMSNEHIVEKIIETEIYFIEPALREKERTNWECKAYDLMLKEIDILKKDRDVYTYYLYKIVKDKVSVKI